MSSVPNDFNEMLAADSLRAADFAIRWCGDWSSDWYLNLCAIPAAGGPPVARSWSVPQTQYARTEIAQWIDARNREREGIYFTPNPVRQNVQKKPSKADLAAVVAVVVDLDPPDDDRPYHERESDVLDLALQIVEGPLKPTATVFSGHGIGLFYRLPEHLAIEELALAEAISKNLHSILGQTAKVDGTWNADRLMRVPHTLNWPNKRKLTLGYPDEPTIAVLVEEQAGRLDSEVWRRLVNEVRDAEASLPSSAPKSGVACDGLAPARSGPDGIDDAVAMLLPAWSSIAVARTEADLDPTTTERFRDALSRQRGLRERWRGSPDGLKDASRSGLVMALAGCLKVAGFDLIDAARIMWVYPYGDLQDSSKYPKDNDAARAIARAWTRSSAPPRRAPSTGQNNATHSSMDEDLPPGFVRSSAGLFYRPVATEKQPDPQAVWIAGPHSVPYECSNADGAGAGLVVVFVDNDGCERTYVVDRRALHESFKEVPAKLDDMGLRCNASTHVLLREYFNRLRVTTKALAVNRGGWHGDAYVMANGTVFGGSSLPVIMRPEAVIRDPSSQQAGTLADWQENIGRLAIGNDLLAVALAAALSGPLLDVAHAESGGIHIVGKSRAGKTSAARAAGSVWGRADKSGQIRQWRATANGLEGVAAATSDAILILDEIGQAEAREVADVVYMLANEAGKQRADRAGGSRERKTWRVIVFSTGEVTVATKLGEAGKVEHAGLQVRLVNLSADAGSGMGLFQNLHGFTKPSDLAEHIGKAAKTFYGTAAPAYLRQLAEMRSIEPEGLTTIIASVREGFLARHLPENADGQVRTVASRFALIAAAGELATAFDVLPWPDGEATRAAGACFDRWLTTRGGAEAAEDRQAMEKVRMFIALHGETRFAPLSEADDDEAKHGPRTAARVGWRRVVDDETEYLILPTTWRSEVCKGIDPNAAASVLAKAGLLKRDSDGLQPKVSIPGEGRPRVYVLSGRILDEG